MGSTGYIDEHGKYVRGEDKKMPLDVNQMHKEWHHDYERKVFARELVQPHVKGRPNPQFIRSYPNYSKKYFTPEQIDKALRDDTGGQI